ncbi:MAG: primosomal protein N' [Gemmatimonadetes bacterium]|nr:primosomal protein N' [Gemmatimonadota bacterium]
MLIDVALPLPIPGTFTYEVAQGSAEPGTRVLVPFGRRRLVGWVVGPGAPPAAGGVRPVLEVLDAATTLTPELFRLCQWIAEYYVAPPGQVFRSALPAVLCNEARPQPQPRTRRILRLTRELPSLQLREEVFGRAQRQRECYEVIESLGGSAEVAHLVEQLAFGRPVLRGLVQKGVAELSEQEVSRDPFAGVTPAPPDTVVLTPAQHSAAKALVEAAAAPGAATPFLLHGVTGSGKTHVYIELIREVVLRRGRGAIVLVPEIALTPQTVARFRAHFGATVSVLHSGLSDGERYDAWRALRSGERRIAVGARSAVFAPVPGLGAIVVDEEHEATYKQEEAPRYHAREVAIMRARLAGAVCVLGSATPSLESWHNARSGKFRLLELPERVEGRPLPPVRIIDLRQSAGGPRGVGHGSAGTRRRGDTATEGRGDTATRQNGAASIPAFEPASARVAGSGAIGEGGLAAPPRRPLAESGRGSGREVLSGELLAAMADRLRRGEQTILLLNRRGYSTFVQCRSCGIVWHCGACNVSLTYHRSRRRLVCHYCFHEESPPASCTGCGSADLSFRGIGTEQVEQAAAEAFPAARIARMDVDTTSGKWSHHQILDRVARGEVDILLGTQMIAKGLDFPGVTLVGVVNADVGLGLPDFRAAERTFQLLAQVAGRAGRGARGGEVLIQTALPGHYAIRAALSHDYVGFATRELEERRGPGYPPHRRLVNVVVSGVSERAVQEAAEAAASWVRRLLRGRDAERHEVAGPAPCPIDRIRGRWRWHFLLRSASAGLLSKVCQELQGRFPPGSAGRRPRVTVDRDPVSLL